MKHQSNLIVYKASAGSGKTYTIAQEFLKLLFVKNISYNDILAVTFTNKAAIEMKSRVLEEIQKQNSESSKNIFNDILKNYDDFTVCTIDSFLQKISGSLFEQGYISTDKILTLDTTPIIDIAVKNTIDEIGIDETLTKNIIQNIEENIKQGKSWDVFDMMKQLFISYSSQNNHTLSKEKLQEALAELNLCIANLKTEINKITTQIFTHLGEHDLNVADFSYGKSGVLGFIEKLHNGEVLEFSIRAKVALASSENWISKTSEKKKFIEPLVTEILLPLLEKIFRLLESSYANYISATLVKRYIYIANIVNKISLNLNREKADKKISFLEDNIADICAVVEKFELTSLQDLFPHNYKYVFIDEFQDLSVQQWDFFKQIIHDTIKNDGISVLVGDPKQSIYRWRGGDCSIMQNKIKEQFASAEVRILDTNWRSLKEITIFNNTFFAIAPALVEENISEEIDQISDSELKFKLKIQLKNFISVYDSHEQKPKPSTNQNGGYIEIVKVGTVSNVTVSNEIKSEMDSTISSNEIFSESLDQSEKSESAKNSWMKLCAERLLRNVEEVQEDGFSLADIAVIVRNNSEARYLINIFEGAANAPEAKKHCSYKITSKVATVLGENDVVNFIISALRYITVASDNLLLAEMRYFLIRNFSETELENWEKKLITSKFLTINELLLKIVQSFNIYRLSPQYVDALFDILEAKKSEFNTTKQFLDWWENYGKNSSLSGSKDSNCIKIYTIHQSKGLQFPITFIPFCNWDLDYTTSTAPILWSKFSKNPKYLGMPVKYSKEMINTDFAEDYFEERMEAYLDNLNLLYVAFTRAVERLYIFIADGEAPTEKCKDISSFISSIISRDMEKKENFFASLNKFFNDDTKFLVIGNKIPCNKREYRSTREILKQKDASILDNRVPVRQFSTNFFLSNYFQSFAPVSEEADFGTKFHAILEKITTANELQKVYDKFLSMTDQTEFRRKVLRNLEGLKVSEFFTKYFNSNWKHLIEQPIFSSEGAIYRPDRIILNDMEAVVVDFKSGTGIEEHKTQLRHYISLVEQVEQKPTIGVLIYFGEEVYIQNQIYQ